MKVKVLKNGRVYTWWYKDYIWRNFDVQLDESIICIEPKYPCFNLISPPADILKLVGDLNHIGIEIIDAGLADEETVEAGDEVVVWVGKKQVKTIINSCSIDIKASARQCSVEVLVEGEMIWIPWGSWVLL